MPGLVIIGAQWGDEGKGKLVDYLSEHADWAVRFQGGNNAGHTLVVNGVKTKLQLIPCGILRAETRCVIGAGVVANPEVLWNEVQSLQKVNISVTPDRLIIDREANLILDYHPALDLAREAFRGLNKIGTTGRGIGPAFEDRAARCGVRFADLFQLNELKPRIEAQTKERNTVLKTVLNSDVQVSFAAVWETITKAAERFLPFVGNGSVELDRALRANSRVVFEGAQATLLDQTFGTVPFVTSCSTLSGSASCNVGVSPKYLSYILGVAKAYCTRVGSGPFPSELTDATGELIRTRGAEFGTVTGRPRRCGWFDAIALRRAARLNGFDSVAIMKLDVLTGIEKLRVCTGYTLNGKELEDLPALASELAQVQPQYVECDGWTESLDQVKSWDELPAAAKRYVELLQQVSGCPVSVISVGAERSATIMTSAGRYLKNFGILE